MGGGIVEARDQAQGGDAGLGEVGVVGVGHQWPHGADVEAIGFGDAQHERLDPAIAARQHRKVGTARDRIEIDVERDLAAFGRAKRLDILRRAGERPFLDAEEHHPKPAPETRNLRRQGALSMALSARSCPSTWALSTTHSSVVPG